MASALRYAARGRHLLRHIAQRHAAALPSCASTHAAAIDSAQADGGEAFWRENAQRELQWRRPFSAVQDHDLDAGRIAWFPGGMLNVAGALGSADGGENRERDRERDRDRDGER